MSKRTFVLIGLAASILLLSSCSSIRYYAQAARGHLDLMSRRVPVSQVLDDVSIDDKLKDQLRLVQELRDFASDDLALPDNDSYRSYADLERSHVLWNVFATERFSVNAKTWCYLFVGCLGYRGYFSEEKARSVGEDLRASQYDVFVGGVAAYSTLGRFNDPVLNTMLGRGDIYLAELIFHELTHQQVYRSGDSAFSESLASFVQQAGVRRWLLSKNDAEGVARYEDYLQRDAQFVNLLAGGRDALVVLYQQGLAEAAMLEQKNAVFNQLRADYQVLKESWGGYAGYDGWFARDLNNAHLVSVSTYHRLIPAFAALYAESNQNMEQFFKRCEELAELDDEALEEIMEGLLLAEELHQI